VRPYGGGKNPAAKKKGLLKKGGGDFPVKWSNLGEKRGSGREKKLRGGVGPEFRAIKMVKKPGRVITINIFRKSSSEKKRKGQVFKR